MEPRYIGRKVEQERLILRIAENVSHLNKQLESVNTLLQVRLKPHISTLYLSDQHYLTLCNCNLIGRISPKHLLNRAQFH